MNTKAVCKQLNVSQKALRIYEDLGIIVPKRDKNNYRNYDENDILKLRQLIILKEMGIELKNIKELINKEFNNENNVLRTLDIQLKAVSSKINELDTVKNILEQSINKVLNDVGQVGYNDCFYEIDKCLSKSRKNDELWLDKWGFDSWAKDYDNTIKNNSYNELHIFDNYDLALDRVAKIILENNASKVIDIGCGTGNLYGKLNDIINFMGIDQSIQMLLQAKKKYPQMNLRIGNFLDEPFIENEFDMVISTFAFHHLNSLEKYKALNLLLRYLKPNGRIVIGDLMFLNQAERTKEKEYLFKIGRTDLWDIIEDEYYTDIEKIKEYAETLKCTVKYEYVANFTWILQITKNY